MVEIVATTEAWAPRHRQTRARRARIMDDPQAKKRAKLASRFGDENADVGFAPIPSGFAAGERRRWRRDGERFEI